MKDGRIKEEGTHEVLMADENGEYSTLIKSFHSTDENEKDNDEVEVDVGRSLILFSLQLCWNCPLFNAKFIQVIT